MTTHPDLGAFSDWLCAEYRVDPGIDTVEVLDAGPQGADLDIRICITGKSYYEVRVSVGRESLQAGFSTEARMVNEAIEQMILDNGGDLNDLLADELCDLGEEPLPMEHVWERPAFRFIVRLPLPGAEALANPALRRRVKAILRACRVLFHECAEEA